MQQSRGSDHDHHIWRERGRERQFVFFEQIGPIWDLKPLWFGGRSDLLTVVNCILTFSLYTSNLKDANKYLTAKKKNCDCICNQVELLEVYKSKPRKTLGLWNESSPVFKWLFSYSSMSFYTTLSYLSSCLTHFTVPQVNFPDVEKVEWINKVCFCFSSQTLHVCSCIFLYWGTFLNTIIEVTMQLIVRLRKALTYSAELTAEQRKQHMIWR